MSVNSYQGLHAEHYDVVYADKPYEAEARFVHDRLTAAGARPGTLLDVACGTGRHALHLRDLGWDVAGVDVNEALVAGARERAGDAASFHVGDMRELDVPGRPFDAVTCLFDAVGYVLTNQGVRAALGSMATHVAEGGLVAVEFLHAPAMLRGARELGVRQWPLDGGGELLRISRTRLDEVQGTMHVAYDVVELGAGGSFRRSQEEQSNRFFSVPEMAALLEGAGLSPVEFVAAYAPDPAVTAETFHVMAVARR